ncbi:Caspase domain-containing protein [Shimia haliotis]|uniref:Caspase domain-containing protein n=2 Tax=Shimia haliotis TaxID=1280847 RepID=A0A1I4FND2_9RHOB|nr:Caspase domain-containing protein [Shimia haliotis]
MGVSQTAPVALVIGNGEYAHVADLKNATRDAQAVALSLQRAGYQTTLIANADRAEMLTALAKLRIAAGEASQIVVYFSGHGAQQNGHGYLLGRDVPPHGVDLARYAVSLQVVMRAISDKPRQKIVFLDACRTPVSGSMAPLSGPALHFPAGTFVAFAAQPGAPAFDGVGSLSPFADALVSEIAGPTQTLGAAMRSIRRRVVASTGGQQVPWSIDVLLQEAKIGRGAATRKAAEAGLSGG